MTSSTDAGSTEATISTGVGPAETTNNTDQIEGTSDTGGTQTEVTGILDTGDDGPSSGMIVAIGTGLEHVCIALAEGEVRCWGGNHNFQLGNGNMEDIGNDPSELPAVDTLAGVKVTQIDGGGTDTCILLPGGNVRCWGWNAWGGLAYEHNNPVPVPGPYIKGNLVVDQISMGESHTCMLSDGEVRCWGNGFWGALGYGSKDDLGGTPGDMPPIVVPGMTQVKQIASGFNHTCVLKDTGTVHCWGESSYGMLGVPYDNIYGDEPNETPPLTVPITGGVEQIYSKVFHTCVILESGGIKCWGDNSYGALGYGHTMNIGDDPQETAELQEVQVTNGSEDVMQVAVSAGNTCVLLDTGKVRCWGLGDHGTNGYGSTTTIGDEPGEMPPADVDLGGDAVQIVAGQLFNCALLVDGTLRCWGMNDFGQLGYGHIENIGDDETPAQAGPVPF